VPCETAVRGATLGGAVPGGEASDETALGEEASGGAVRRGGGKSCARRCLERRGVGRWGAGLHCCDEGSVFGFGDSEIRTFRTLQRRFRLDSLGNCGLGDLLNS
jgi:hypothetical protein